MSSSAPTSTPDPNQPPVDLSSFPLISSIMSSPGIDAGEWLTSQGGGAPLHLPESETASATSILMNAARTLVMMQSEPPSMWSSLWPTAQQSLSELPAALHSIGSAATQFAGNEHHPGHHHAKDHHLNTNQVIQRITSELHDEVSQVSAALKG